MSSQVRSILTRVRASMHDTRTCKKNILHKRGDLCCEDLDKKLEFEIDDSICRWQCHYIVSDVSKNGQ